MAIDAKTKDDVSSYIQVIHQVEEKSTDDKEDFEAIPARENFAQGDEEENQEIGQAEEEFNGLVE